MSNQNTRALATRIVNFIKELPEDRIQHYADFKNIQLQRFAKVANPSMKTEDTKKNDGLSLSDIKDMLTRTKSPLGLQKSVLKKFAQAVPQENWNETLLTQQLSALDSLKNNTYKKMYDVTDKLYKPEGNPQYYQRLYDEITGKSKENFFTAMRTVFTGK
ncbi:related to Cytochrome B pre-mRNA-processing protein 6 [Hanseniaspora guilliermondii]|uniref:Related to Cytochrome B pre-mRNA-processing protein 6 n=1 Tax=Hanseniaspora guilliermondii TaxID=56406 RepID=A0A1L0AXE2_9ASCO|nr:related to Cytochrome B pre-mRNA-processing protein 6 [Hanseniaspora guilliermondii]